MGSTVCTLFEGDYHYGVGALVNSLHRSGFRGEVWAGYKGTLPAWMEGNIDASGSGCVQVTDGIALRLVCLGVTSHLNNYKPRFILDLWEIHCPDSEQVFYFDPDIVVRAPWSFFEHWAGCGIALCEDGVYGNLPNDHPHRAAWRAFAQSRGQETTRQLDRYFNGGFIGLDRRYISATVLWQDLMDGLGDVGVSLSDFKPGSRYDPFFGTDQDVLNLMAMITPHPLSTMGPEGMDFIPGGYTMSHAATNPKPWRKRFVRRALEGFAPTTADKHFLANTQQPIRLYSSWKHQQMKIALRCGAALGRFIRRT